MNQPKGNLKWLLIVLAVVILGGAYLVYAKYDKTSTILTARPSPTLTSKISPSASISVSPTASSNVPTDWKTYSNTSDNFLVKYPSNWTYSESSAIVFSEPGGHWEFQVEVSATNKSLSDIAKAKIMELGGGAAGGSGVVDSDTTVGGVNAKKITVPTPEAARKIFYLVVRNNKLYTLTLAEENTETNLMLSTFQFTK